MNKKLILLLVLLLTACSPKIDEQVSYDENIEVEYEGNFRYLTFEDLFNAIENKKSGIFVLGSYDCPNCSVQLTTLSQQAEGVVINYVDVKGYNAQIQEKLVEYGIIESQLYVPNIFIVIEGQVVDKTVEQYLELRKRY